MGESVIIALGEFSGGEFMYEDSAGNRRVEVIDANGASRVEERDSAGNQIVGVRTDARGNEVLEILDFS